MDSAGDQHLHIEHNIYKRRVDLKGNPIEEAKKEEIITSTTKKENIVSWNTCSVVCGNISADSRVIISLHECVQFSMLANVGTDSND